MVKMKKKLVSVTLVLLIILIAGCTSSKRTDKPTEVNYRTGTQGLALEFPTDTPTQVYEKDHDVRFSINVKNKGAFPQSDEKPNFRGKLWIGGYDENIIEITPREAGSITSGVELDMDELEGISPYNLNGGSSPVEFQMSVNELPAGMPFYNPKIIVTSSYKYQTLASPLICIDPEPRSTKIREKVCTIQQSISPGSQGAPVAVSKIEEDVTSSDILFKIYIDNVGGGLVIPEDKIDDNPNQGYDWRELNKVIIESVSVGNIDMSECRPAIRDDVQLTDNKGFIFCRWDKNNAAGKAYETPINIKLSYGYTTSIERQIEVFEEVSFR